MNLLLAICVFAMLAFGTIAVMLHSLRKQRDVAMREVAVLSQRIGEIENNIKDQENTSEKVEPVDLSQVTEEALFQHITAIIKDEELFLQPTFGRAEVMERFSCPCGSSIFSRRRTVRFGIRTQLSSRLCMSPHCREASDEFRRCWPRFWF